jgi:hypothetical protein
MWTFPFTSLLEKLMYAFHPESMNIHFLPITSFLIWSPYHIQENLPPGYVRSASVNSNTVIVNHVHDSCTTHAFHFECWLKVMCNGGRRNLLLSVNSTAACSTQLDHNTETLSPATSTRATQPAHPLISLKSSPGHEPTKRSRRYHSAVWKGYGPAEFLSHLLSLSYEVNKMNSKQNEDFCLSLRIYLRNWVTNFDKKLSTAIIHIVQ